MQPCSGSSIWLKRIVICVLAYLSVLSFARVISLNGEGAVYFGGTYFGYNLSSILLFAVTALLLHRYFCLQDKRLKIVSTVGGILLGVAIVYGGYAHYINDIFISVPEGILQIFLVMGISACTTPICAELFQLPERMQAWYAAGQQAKPTGRFWVFFERHPRGYFFLSWGIFILSDVPIFLSQWPGNFVFDSIYQFSEELHNSYSTHHPILHTLLLGKTYRLGEQMGNVSAGCQFYTLLQMLILSSAFAYLLFYLYRRNVPRCIRVGVFLWYALFPMHQVFAISATKDVLFAAFFLYYAILLFRFAVDREHFARYDYVFMIVTGVLLCLLRNNGVYALAVSGVILLICLKPWKSKAKYILVLTAVLLLQFLCNQGLAALTHAVSKDTQRETLCMPLQCMARVASYRKSELAPELYDEVCLYIPEGDISKYSPYCADFVKQNADEILLRTNKLNFFKLWAKIGLEFPDEYFENLITNTLGYWYPLNQGIYVSADMAIYHMLIGTENEIIKHDFFPLVTGYYEYLFYHLNFRNVPILGYLFRNAPYVWLLVLALLWSIYKKRYDILGWGMILLMYLGTCFLGPMAALRYIYCLIVCAPLLLYAMLCPKVQQEEHFSFDLEGK